MADLRPYAYEGGRVRLASLPNVSAGPQVTAEQMGAGRARELYNLGGAALGAGMAVTNIATIKQNRVDETTARDLDTRANDEYRDYEKNVLLQKKGLDAKDIEKEADAWWRAKQAELEEATKDIRNPNIRHGFAARLEQLRTRSVDAMSNYGFAQVEEANRISRIKQNEGFLRDAENEDLLNSEKQEELRRLRHQNIRANLSGQDAAAVEMALAESDREFYTGIAKSHAARSPANALQYLDQEKVKAAFTPAEWQELRGKYLKETFEAEKSRMIDVGIAEAAATIIAGGDPGDIYLQLVGEVGKEVADKVMGGVDKWAGYVAKSAEQAEKIEKKRRDDEEKAKEEERKEREERRKQGDAVLSRTAGEEGRRLGGDESLTESAIREQAFANWPEKYAKTVVEAAAAERKAFNADRIAAQAERKSRLQNAYAETKFNMAAMPKDLKLSVLEREELIKWGNAFQANGGKNPPPDINFLYRLEGMSQDDLQEYLLNPDNMEEFYRGVGGAGSKYATQFIDKALGRVGEKRPLTDTNEGWGAARYADDEGLVLGSERDGDQIRDFSKRFVALSRNESRKQGLKNENDLSEDDREKVYQKMRALGKYVKWPAINRLSMGLLGSEERTYYGMLADEDADFESFQPYGEDGGPAPVYSASPAEDDNFWAAGSGVTPAAAGPRATPAAATSAPEIPAAVLDVIGRKGNVETIPIAGPDGSVRFVKVVEKTASGVRTAYLDANGRTVSEETALAGQ